MIEWFAKSIAVFLAKENIITKEEDDKLVIIACHDAEEMEILADEIIVMKAGKVVCENEKIK